MYLVRAARFNFKHYMRQLLSTNIYMDIHIYRYIQIYSLSFYHCILTSFAMMSTAIRQYLYICPTCHLPSKSAYMQRWLLAAYWMDTKCLVNLLIPLVKIEIKRTKTRLGSGTL